ncbi:MAG: phage portal protein [Candidatus Caldarchaeum sp.]
MSFLRRVFAKQKNEKGIAAGAVFTWSRGEEKPLNQEKVLELVEGNDYLRAAIEISVNACLASGWVVDGDEDEVKQAEAWITEREHDFYMFLRNLATSLRIFGEAYIEVAAEPVFKVLDAQTMQVKRDQYGRVEYFVQTVFRDVRFEKDEIVWLRTHTLGTRAYPLPIAATLRKTLEGQMAAELFIRDAFTRKGVLAKAFVLRSGTQQDLENFMNVLNQSGPGSSLVLLGDVEITDLGKPFKDLEVLEILREYRQKIISATGVPPVLLGIEGGTNLETSRWQVFTFTMNIQALQQLIGAGVTEALRRRLGLQTLVFKLNPWTNPEQETRLHVLRVKSGLETINEARKALGLSELDHPLANTPIITLKQTTESELAVSEQFAPTKAVSRERNVRRLEDEFFRELRRLFDLATQQNIRARQEYGERVHDTIHSFLTRAALEGVFYLDDVDAAPPTLEAASQTVEKLLPVFEEDFWTVVGDKIAGLTKPSKPSRDYSKLFKTEVVGEDDVYPPQRLDYVGRLRALITTALWAAFNHAKALVLRKIKTRKKLQVRWLTAQDEKVCGLCAPLDGHTWTLEELDSAAFMQPPLHPNCRCTLIISS